jgi:hypothetical protein
VQRFSETGRFLVILSEEQDAEVDRRLLRQVINIRVEGRGTLCGVFHGCPDRPVPQLEARYSRKRQV